MRGKFESNITRIISETTGMSIVSFCEEELDTKSNTFYYRLKNNTLYPSEIVQIVNKTGRTIEYLFGKAWYEMMFTSSGKDRTRMKTDEKVRKTINKMSEKDKRGLEERLGLGKKIRLEDLFTK